MDPAKVTELACRVFKQGYRREALQLLQIAQIAPELPDEVEEASSPKKQSYEDQLIAYMQEEMFGDKGE